MGHNREIVQEFLDDVIRALREEKLKVLELTKKEVADRSFPVTIGYECTLRDIKVVVSTEKREILLDGVSLGEDILSSLMPDTHTDRYSLLRGDIGERYVFQQSDVEAALRAVAEVKREKSRVGDYAGLAEKIRAKTPRPRGGKSLKKK